MRSKTGAAITRGLGASLDSYERYMLLRGLYCVNRTNLLDFKGFNL